MLRPPMKRETLQAWVNRLFEEDNDLSEVKVSARAKRLGHRISPGYVSNIRTGKARNPSVDFIKALAAGLGKTEDEVDAKARGVQLREDPEFQESEWAVMWNDYRHLSPARQKEVASLKEVLHRELRRRL